MIPKVTKRPRASMSEHRWRDIVRDIVHDRVRAKYRHYVGVVCERCCDPGTEMHETVFRSLTRGRPPVERFHSSWCLWLCRQCHEDLQQHKSEVWFETLEGANGRTTFRPLGEAMPGMFTPRQVWEHVVGKKLN